MSEYAFPFQSDWQSEGMELREYFAAKAMTSFLAPPYTLEIPVAAASAYVMADEMMKNRTVKQDDAIARMHKLVISSNAENGAPDSDHGYADDILCEVLTSLGYGKLVDEFKNVKKWYH